MSDAQRLASQKLKEMLDTAVPDPTPMTVKEMKEKLVNEKSIGEFLSQTQKLKEENKRQV